MSGTMGHFHPWAGRVGCTSLSGRVSYCIVLCSMLLELIDKTER